MLLSDFISNIVFHTVFGNGMNDSGADDGVNKSNFAVCWFEKEGKIEEHFQFCWRLKSYKGACFC